MRFHFTPIDWHNLISLITPSVGKDKKKQELLYIAVGSKLLQSLEQAFWKYLVKLKMHRFRKFYFLCVSLENCQHGWKQGENVQGCLFFYNYSYRKIRGIYKWGIIFTHSLIYILNNIY